MRHGRGFSLVELLVVVAIMAILVSLLLPVVSQIRAKAKWSVCISNLRSMGLGIHAYADDFHGVVPYMYTTWTGMEPLKMDWKPIGMGLLVGDYILQADLAIFKAPTDYTSVMNINGWKTKKDVCGDYQYWQHRFPSMFNKLREETVLQRLQECLIMADQVGDQDWAGFEFRANHHDGVHFLGGNGSVDFLKYPLNQGIPCTTTAWPELKLVVNEMEKMLENQ